MSPFKRQGPDFVPFRKTGRRLRKAIVTLLLLLAPPAVPHLLALRIPPPPPGPADAVIVLSGGEGRIAEGFKAWVSGAGKDLCILGAGRTVMPSRLLPEAAGLSAEVRSRILVEGWSENTLENAFSAKSIVSERGYSSVILVTSDYHVPRAYLAFRKVLAPEVALYVRPVRAERGDPAGDAWRWARRRFLEGWKYWGYRVLLRRE